jgi:excinuclease UvrABC ATPase subunit
LSAGREITEAQVTDDIALHNANPSLYPVVTYDSCAACQGIDVFYNVKLDQVVVTMESLNQSMEVHNTDNMFEVRMIGAQAVMAGSDNALAVNTTDPRFEVKMIGAQAVMAGSDNALAVNTTDPSFEIRFIGATVNITSADTTRFAGLSSLGTPEIRGEGITGQTIAPPDTLSAVGDTSQWGHFDNLENWVNCV